MSVEAATSSILSQRQRGENKARYHISRVKQLVKKVQSFISLKLMQKQRKKAFSASQPLLSKRSHKKKRGVDCEILITQNIAEKSCRIDHRHTHFNEWGHLPNNGYKGIWDINLPGFHSTSLCHMTDKARCKLYLFTLVSIYLIINAHHFNHLMHASF